MMKPCTSLCPAFVCDVCVCVCGVCGVCDVCVVCVMCVWCVMCDVCVCVRVHSTYAVISISCGWPVVAFPSTHFVVHVFSNPFHDYHCVWVELMDWGGVTTMDGQCPCCENCNCFKGFVCFLTCRSEHWRRHNTSWQSQRRRVLM